MTTPPRFVPTLTEVVHATTGFDSPVELGKTLDADAVQDQLVQRILQRVDLSLDRCLREAVGALVLAQTQNLAPLLREQIEITVRDAVRQAMAQETGGAPGTDAH